MYEINDFFQLEEFSQNQSRFDRFVNEIREKVEKDEE